MFKKPRLYLAGELNDAEKWGGQLLGLQPYVEIAEKQLFDPNFAIETQHFFLTGGFREIDSVKRKSRFTELCKARIKRSDVVFARFTTNGGDVDLNWELDFALSMQIPTIVSFDLGSKRTNWVEVHTDLGGRVSLTKSFKDAVGDWLGGELHRRRTQATSNVSPLRLLPRK